MKLTFPRLPTTLFLLNLIVFSPYLLGGFSFCMAVRMRRHLEGEGVEGRGIGCLVLVVDRIQEFKWKLSKFKGIVWIRDPLLL